MKTTEQKLDKTTNTISNHMQRGNNLTNNSRSVDLYDRYNDLMELAKEQGVWDKYCDTRHYSREHTAGDCFC